jgi:hypothetical protein
MTKVPAPRLRVFIIVEKLHLWVKQKCMPDRVLVGRLRIAWRRTYGVIPKKATPERPLKKATTVESAARLCGAPCLEIFRHTFLF